jgi:predicted oxidoreductase
VVLIDLPEEFLIFLGNFILWNAEQLTAICQAYIFELSRNEWFKLFIARRGNDVP